MTRGTSITRNHMCWPIRTTMAHALADSQHLANLSQNQGSLLASPCMCSHVIMLACLIGLLPIARDALVRYSLMSGEQLTAVNILISFGAQCPILKRRSYVRQPRRLTYLVLLTWLKAVRQKRNFWLTSRNGMRRSHMLFQLKFVDQFMMKNYLGLCNHILGHHRHQHQHCRRDYGAEHHYHRRPNLR